MGTVLDFKIRSLKAQKILTADKSGVLETFSTQTNWGVVRLREDQDCLVRVQLSTCRPYVPENQIRGWKAGEKSIMPRRGDWIVLILYPPDHPLVISMGQSLASYWAVVPKPISNY